MQRGLRQLPCLSVCVCDFLSVRKSSGASVCHENGATSQKAMKVMVFSLKLLRCRDRVLGWP